MANRYVAGASGLPFAVLRGYGGTDLPAHTATIAPITCPFTGEVLTAVPALNPDVASSTPSAPTAAATSSCGASPACRRRRCSPPAARWSRSRRSSTSSTRCPARSCCRPGWSPRWPRCPAAPHPSYAQGYYDRDNDYYQRLGRDQPGPGRRSLAWLDATRAGCRGSRP